MLDRLRSLRSQPGAALFLIFLGGSALRFHKLSSKTLWYDEAVLYWVSRGDLFQVISQNALRNSAPPLFSALLSLITRWGSSEFALRLLPWAAGSLAIPAMYLLARQFLSRPGSLTAALLIAVAPVQIEYSQQVREYSLSVLLSILMLIAFKHFLARPRPQTAVALTVTILVSLFTQYGLALLILSLNAVFLVHLVWVTGPRRRLVVLWVAVQSVGLLATAVVFNLALEQQFQVGGFGSQAHLSAGYWETGTVVSAARFVYGRTRDLIEFALPGPLFAVMVYVGLVVLAYDRLKDVEFPLVTFPFVVTAIAGLLRLYPYLGWRQDLFLTPILYLAAGFGFEYAITVDRRRILAIVILIVLVRKVTTSVANYYESPGSSSVGRIVEQLKDLGQASDPIYVCDANNPVLRYYFDVRFPEIEKPIVERDLGDHARAYLEQADMLISESERVWFLLDTSCGNPEPFLEHLSSLWHVEKIMDGYPGALYVVR